MSSSLPTPVSSRLVRTSNDRRIAGVCSGIGEYFAIDPIIVRLVFVALAFGGIGFLLYPVLWLVMPSTAGAVAQPGQGFAEMRQQVQQVAQQVQHRVQPGVGAQFDPMTGRPINAEPPRFDPYTGAPVSTEANTTAVPITNHAVNAASAGAGTVLAPQERRRRFLGVALVGLGILSVGNLVFHTGALLLPVLLVVGGFMLLRRAA